MTLSDIIKESIKAIGDNVDDDLSASVPELLKNPDYRDRIIALTGVINRGLQRAYQLKAYRLKTLSAASLPRELKQNNLGSYRYDLSIVSDLSELVDVIFVGDRAQYAVVGNTLVAADEVDSIVYKPLAAQIPQTVDYDADIVTLGIDTHIAIALPLWAKYELMQYNDVNIARLARDDFDNAVTGREVGNISIVGRVSNVYNVEGV